MLDSHPLPALPARAHTLYDLPSPLAARVRLAMASPDLIGIPRAALPPGGFETLFVGGRRIDGLYPVIRVYLTGPQAHVGIEGPTTVYFWCRRGGWVAVT